MTEPDTRALLLDFIAAESETLLGTLRLYILRAGLATGQGSDAAAADLLGEVTVQALASADRFRLDARPMPWLLGIAANLIKRRQVDQAKRGVREPLVTDLAGREGQGLSEAELFDRLGAIAAGDPGRRLEQDEAVSEILGRLSPGDAQIIRLAVLHDLSGEELARTLDITPGAARVRLHRALNRLRAAWPGDQPLAGS
jgi:RNA polymerase sigma factor (sigma-70 family)